MTKKIKENNRNSYQYINPLQKNQHFLRTTEEIQSIIGSYPDNWTKKDFRGEGKNNQKKILTRKETERPGLVFGATGGSKQYKNGKLKCSMCGIFKDLEEFPDDRYGSSNGKRSNCSSCDALRNRRYRESIKKY